MTKLEARNPNQVRMTKSENAPAEKGPTSVHSDDYALRDYAVTEKELDRFVKQMNRKIAQERKKGTIKKYSGNLEADLAD
jgi:hypothetical protein